MKNLIVIFFCLFTLVLSGCATPVGTNRYDAAIQAYHLRVAAAGVNHPRVEFKVPEGTRLEGGFSLVVSDPSNGVAPMEVPESDFQSGARVATGLVPWVAGAYVGGRAVANRQAPAPTVVRPEIITVPAEGFAPPVGP